MRGPAAKGKVPYRHRFKPLDTQQEKKTRKTERERESCCYIVCLLRHGAVVQNGRRSSCPRVYVPDTRARHPPKVPVDSHTAAASARAASACAATADYIVAGYLSFHGEYCSTFGSAQNDSFFSSGVFHWLTAVFYSYS